jgi:DNA-binding transcriptional MerR regulator/methylmalonyl-CoA mutase cobalamin-binding subunit
MDSSPQPISIAAAAQQTGLPVDLLRAWERRYQAVVPRRSPSGRRFYTTEDVQRLLLLKQVLGLGHRIGDVARLSGEDLKRLQESTDPGSRSPAAADPGPSALRPGERHTPGETPVPPDRLDLALAAIAALDAPGLGRCLEEAALRLSLPALLDRLVVPLLIQVGERWQSGGLRIGQEHLASSVLRGFLGSLLLRRSQPSGAPCLVTGCPRGQQHELGALMAALSAQEDGFEAIHLGPDLPAEELAALTASLGARALGLAVSHRMDLPGLLAELMRLRAQLPAAVPVILGGREASAAYEGLGRLGLQEGFLVATDYARMRGILAGLP